MRASGGTGSLHQLAGIHSFPRHASPLPPPPILEYYTLIEILVPTSNPAAEYYEKCNHDHTRIRFERGIQLQPKHSICPVQCLLAMILGEPLYPAHLFEIKITGGYNGSRQDLIENVSKVEPVQVKTWDMNVRAAAKNWKREYRTT